MPGLRNSLTNYMPTACVVTGTVTYSGATPSLTALSGSDQDQACVTIAAVSTGVATITVTGFRGSNGSLKGFATGTTISNMVSCTAGTYTTGTNTANFTFKVEDDGSTAVDNGYNFQLWAD